MLIEAASLNRKSGEAEGSAVPRIFRGNVLTLLSTRCPLPCHPDRSVAKRRDLPLNGPQLETRQYNSATLIFYYQAQVKAKESRDRRSRSCVANLVILPVLIKAFVVRGQVGENRTLKLKQIDRA